MKNGITLALFACVIFLGVHFAYGQTASLSLSWTDNSNNEDVFEVERCQGAACANFALIGNTPANVSKFTDTGLLENTLYRYRVRASNSAGASIYSNIAEATTGRTIPNAPSGLQAMALSPTSASLQWDNPDGAMIRLTRASMQGTGTSLTLDLPAGTTNYIDSGLRRNTSYCYSVEPVPVPDDYAAQTDCVRTPKR